MKKSSIHVTKRILICILAVAVIVVQCTVFLSSSKVSAAGSNLALGKTVTANGYTQNYEPANINDGNVNTYWEGVPNSYPNTLTVDLGSSATVNSVVLKLNPAAAWATRTQTLSVLASIDNSTYSTIAASSTYTFNPGSGNTAYITFANTTARYVRLNFTANSGAAGGQVAEFEIYGPDTAGTPDLVVTDISWNPANPAAGNPVTLSATIKNQGTGATPAGIINGVAFQIDGGGTTIWSDNNTASIPEGGSITVTANGGTAGSTWNAVTGSHTILAWVDDVNRMTESNENNNTYTENIIVGSNTVAAIPGKLEAEGYSAMSGIQTETCSEGTLDVGWTDTGDWMDYSVNVAQSGAYTVDARVSSPNSNTAIKIQVSGSDLATINVPNTGGWQNWVTASTSINLNAGVQTLRVYISAGGLNINYFNFASRVTQTKPDLIVTDITYTPLSPAAGNAVTFSAVVKNQGNAAGAAGIVAFQLDGVQVAASANSTASLAANSSLTVTAAGTWTAAGGTHLVTAAADNNNTTAESNETNNTYSENISVSGGSQSNLALGKPITASSTVYTFIAANANDGIVTTYWEGTGGSYPNTLTVSLGANANLSSVVLKLNPDPAWSTRTQTIEVLGHDQNSTAFSTLVASKAYTFDPTKGNSVTIPISAASSDIMLKFTSNSGSSAGQVAEFEVYGTPAPNPDLTITGIDWSPAYPVETDAITMNAVVKNTGTASAAASNVKFYMGTTLAGTASTPVIAANASVNVSVNIGAQNSGTYTVTAKADEGNTLIELDNNNNNYTAASSLVVNQVSSSDLIGTVSWTPNNPSGGNTVTFTANLKNQGNIASGSGSHGITLVLKDTSGNTIKTFNGSYSGTLAAGAAADVSMGTWTAVNGSYNLTCTIAADVNEVSIKQANNTKTASFYVGRGANMPFTLLEAESLSNSTNGERLTPNYKLADFAGEASGRSAVKLSSTGQYVEFTLSAPANAFVLRNAVAENTSGTISVYVNGTDKGNFNVSSKFSYVYASPTTLDRLGYNNSPSGTAYWLYDDAQLMLDQVYPTGTKLRIQKDSGDVPFIYLDLLETENAAPAAVNPDPTKYVQVSSTKSIDQALLEFRQDSTKSGIFIPEGTWTLSSKIDVYGRATEILGAGPWWTRLVAPQDQTNTDIGFSISANGSSIKNLSAWGNYVYRSDGPGKFINGDGMQNVTVDNVWIEHFVCMYWGVKSSNNTFKNCRIKNTFADGINMTNGSSYNTIDNCYARATGDDSFALFSAIDGGGASYNTGNVYSNDTAVCVRRAACFAVYGGSDNRYINLYGADTLTYPGITISSLSFGYNTLGFGDKDCVFDGITLDRCGGDFYTSSGADDKVNDYQNFGAIWVFDGDRTLQNVLVKNVDINDPVYFGIQFQTKYPEALAMKNIRFENVNINNAPRYGVKLTVLAESGQGPCVGEATLTNVKINNPGVMPIYGQSGCPNFKLTVN